MIKHKSEHDEVNNNLSETPDIPAPTRFYLGEGVSLSEQDKANCIRLVSEARMAICHPGQSGYHVKTAGLTENGRFVRGGNDENSVCDAYCHGETSVMSQARTLGEQVRMIGFHLAAEKPDDLGIAPCGACRDVLEQNASPDLLLIGGDEKIIVVKRFADFLKEDFDDVDVQKVDAEGVRWGIVALRSAAIGYITEDVRKKLYGVALIGENGLPRARGSFDTNAGYDAIPAGLAAAETFRNTVDPAKPEDLREIVVAGLGDIPRLLNRDKAELLELDEVLRMGGRNSPLPIYLVAVDPKTLVPTKAQCTNTEECFPNPFSAGSFGMTEALGKIYGALFHEKR